MTDIITPRAEKARQILGIPLGKLPVGPKGKVTLPAVKQYARSNPGLAVREHPLYSPGVALPIQNPELPTGKNGEPEWSREGADMTGLTAREVFHTFPKWSEIFNFGPKEGYMHVPGDIRELATQCGRGYALVHDGDAVLETEFDGTPAAPGAYFVYREQLHRLILVWTVKRETKRPDQAGWQAVTEEWDPNTRDFEPHPLQMRVFRQAMNENQVLKGTKVVARKYSWIVAFTKYHIAAQLLAIAGGMSRFNGITLINGPYAQEYLYYGYLSELWRLSGFSYWQLPQAKRYYQQNNNR
jgi:hypothetical protein